LAYSEISVRSAGPVGVITMTESALGNPLAPEGSEREIQDALMAFQADRDIRSVVLTGTGDVFSLGNVPRNDPEVHGGRSLGERFAFGYSRGNFWYWLPEFRKLLIAAVNGRCEDGAWELALMCDLIVAADSASFSMNHLDMGVNPCHTTCHYLTRALGKHRAMDVVLNARTLDAARCLSLGLVNYVVADGDCLAFAEALGRRLSARPPVTTAATMRLIAGSGGLPAEQDLERAVAFFLRTTEETRQAAEAYGLANPRPV
jgi:enoyl-CoA hydratase/carnithine racemase